jgi:cell division protein FtsB
MPYISENGQTKFVTQAEFEAFNTAQGIPNPPRRGRSTSDSATAPAGGAVTDLSSPNNGLTSKERRALVTQQQAQVESELSSVDATLAQASTGKISLSPEAVAKLEARKNQLVDNSNQLQSGQPVTDGSVEGGRATQKILNPNTSNTSPDQPLPTTSEKTANNSNVDPNAGYVPQSNRTGAVPTPEFETRPLAPTEDDAINQAVNEARAARQVPASEVAQSPTEFSGSVPTSSAQFVPSYNFANNAPLEQAPEDQQGAVFNSDGQVVGYRSRGIVETITRDAADQPVSVDPGAAARALATPGVFVNEPDPVADTNTLGVTTQFTGVNQFQQGVPADDPLSGIADENEQRDKESVVGGSLRTAATSQENPFTNPYGDRPEPSVDQINTDPVSPADSGTGYVQGFGTNPEFINTDPNNVFAANQQQLKDEARNQQALREQKSGFNDKDWRVRLALSQQAQYLYKVAAPGEILYPLNITNGVIFPYTPQIQTSYRANYEKYDMTHSNMRGLFYKNSSPGEIQINGTFTAQDTNEANYLLAVIHFFKTATKMFYGQDAQAGTPPPILYLSGHGQYQYHLHPCVLESFNYNLPADVDYIRAGSVTVTNTNLITRRDRQSNVPTSTSPIYSAISRLKTIFTPKGALPQAKAMSSFDTAGNSTELGANNSTYVPTHMEIQLTLIPIQSRSQMSKQFSVKEFAQGNLLRGGFW